MRFFASNTNRKRVPDHSNAGRERGGIGEGVPAGAFGALLKVRSVHPQPAGGDPLTARLAPIGWRVDADGSGSSV